MTQKKYIDNYIRHHRQTRPDFWATLDKRERENKMRDMRQRIKAAATEVSLQSIDKVTGGDGKTYYVHRYVLRGEFMQYACSERLNPKHFCAFVANPYPA